MNRPQKSQQLMAIIPLLKNIAIEKITAILQAQMS